MTHTSRFPLLGEPLAVDLVNTRMRRNGADVDLLDRPTALSAWLKAQRRHLAWSGAVSAADLKSVHTLRDAIAELLHALRTRRIPAVTAVRAVNRAAADPASHPRLEWTTNTPRLAASTARAQRHALLRVLATDAIKLITGPQAALLRECAHPDCVLQFIASNPRRRWCSDALCGNRARVARHYQQQHPAH